MYENQKIIDKENEKLKKISPDLIGNIWNTLAKTRIHD